MFLGPDGLRLFSATDRVGDFGLAVVSKPIQTEITDLISSSTVFTSTEFERRVNTVCLDSTRPSPMLQLKV